MNPKKVRTAVMVVVATWIAGASCSPAVITTPVIDAGGEFLRLYSFVSNTWDLDDLNHSGFTAIYESVDQNSGADLKKIEFYATHKSGATGLITNEALVKTIDSTTISASFATVPAPTLTEYLRSGPITITYAETIAGLSSLTTDPDGTSCTGTYPDVCTMVAFPGSLQEKDEVIFRVAIYDKKDRLFTVANPQTTVTPALGNQADVNISANLTGGLFYANPMLYTINVVRTTTTGNADAYTGYYQMTQVARWQPDHSASQQSSFSWIDEIVFGNSNTDSTQVVILNKVTGGLPTEREFTCKYRGNTISMTINLENTPTGLTQGAITTMINPSNVPGQPAATPQGLGFPAGTTADNVGTVWVPLLNTEVNCTSTRQFYQVTPLGGTFVGSTSLAWGYPRGTVPNRGAYRNDRDGLTPGDVFCIGVDDDADEYGHRNGYCDWYTRVLLTMKKL